MIRVFLSYAREDAERVERLYQNLAAAGFVPWMDRHDLVPGEEWFKGIQRGIESADCFLACISPRSLGKGGVLENELQAALDRWRKKRGDYRLIPVRLEECKIPSSLEHLQWFDLFREEQWTGLARAIRSRTRRFKWLYAAAPAVILLAAATWWFGIPRPAPRWPPGAARVGVTLWRLREAKANDQPGSKMLVQPRSGAVNALQLVPERAPLGGPFTVGDRVRASIEPAQPGYLYVIDREQKAGGALGPPKLIFPTLQIRGGRNQVAAGQLIEIPAQEDDPPYWEFQKQSGDYAGELLTVLFAHEPVAALAPAEGLKDLDDSWLQGRLREWEVAITKTGGASGSAATPSEIAAGRNGSKMLTHGDPLPQTIFSGTPKRGAPLAVSFPVRVAQ